MKVIIKSEEMTLTSRRIKTLNQKIGFVPTMGALHRGHLELIKSARRETDFVVVSIYVNPIQFRKGEDFEKYPRNLKKDMELVKKLGVDVVFAPDDKEMYPPGFSTFVEVKGRLSSTLEGKFRPSHFRGVATVVAKLFNIVLPDVAYFGKKDYQQLQVIRKMVADLNYNIKIKEVETVREKDGLALSSRNSYLSEKEKKKATCIYQALNRARSLIEKNERNTYNIVQEMEKIILPNVTGVDYISIVDAETFKKLKKVKGKVLVAVAVRIGTTRLIDNIVLEV